MCRIFSLVTGFIERKKEDITIKFIVKPHKISAFYLDKQFFFDPSKKYGLLVIETLECKIYAFLNTNTCFCSGLCGFHLDFELSTSCNWVSQYYKLFHEPNTA